MKRVVVTGIGILSPLGHNTKQSWQNLIEGKSGLVKLQGSDYDKLPCRVAAPIKNFDISNQFTKSELRTMAPATAYALVATKEALDDSSWKPKDKNSLERTGVAIGMGMVDLSDICETNEALKRSYNRVSPFFVPRILPNMAAGNVSIKYGFQGPNHSVSTACATGAHAIGDAFRFIQRGDADVMVCGGAEACISPLSIAAFCRLRALSVAFNDRPEEASRPFDKHRDGFIMGEGSAVLILEELEHALERKAKIYSEILGYGLSGDGSHLTAPCTDGRGAALAMSRALKDANVSPDEVGYINAHATSTPLGDAVETRAVKAVFKDHSTQLSISSTKGAHGHLLGSAGNLETAFTVLSVKKGIIPGTLNLNERGDDLEDLRYVNKKQEWIAKGRRVAIKNAFGFGGTNTSLCLAEFGQS